MPNAPLEDGILANKEAEEAVIGSLLLDVSYLPSLNLTPDSFSSPCSRLWFVAISDVARRGEGVDQITVSHELDRVGKLTEAGGVAYAAHVTAKLPTTLNCPHYAAIVRDLADRRALIAAATTMIERTRSADKAETALSDADRTITELRRRSKSMEVITPHDRADMMLAEYEQRRDRVDSIALKTGVPRLDMALGGGVYPGELMVIGARPGVGKTTFLQCVANRLGDLGQPVLFASAEMTVSGLTDRDVSDSTGLPLYQIRSGRYDDPTYQRIINSVGMLAERNVYFLPRGGMTTARIALAAEWVWNKAGNLRLIVVDHLGRLRPQHRGQPRHIELGEMTSELADLAKEFNCPVMLACQLSRGLEQKDDKRPTLADLRESGRIEEDADIVLMLYRQGYYAPDQENVTELLVRKLRQSDQESNVVRVTYDRRTGYKEL